MDKEYSTYKLKIRQELPLEQKIQLSKRRIEEWYYHWDGNVYVSFSGGKDSTVLLHLVRSLFPDVKGLFVNTGLEYPEIVDFIRNSKNIIEVKPRKNFKDVLNKYGYPVVSKKISMGVSRYRNTKSDLQKHLRLYGGTCLTGKKQNPTISKKWHYLINAPFKISEKCCYIMKKQPIKSFEKETGLIPFIGTMASESTLRMQEYKKNGCNAFNKNNPSSNPLSFWTDNDIWEYISKYSVNYSKIYDMGEKRTGCMFCMFGVQLEKGSNRFQRMQKSHPKQWNYCINKLGCGKVLDYINVDYHYSNQIIQPELGIFD